MGEGKKQWDRKYKVDDETINMIREQLESVQYGSVTIVIHEGKITQIDTNTKVRLH